MGKVSLSCQSFLEEMQHVSNCIDDSIDCEVCVYGGGRGHCEPELSLSELANMDWGCRESWELLEKEIDVEWFITDKKVNWTRNL